MRLDFSVQVNPPPGSALLNHEAVRRFGVYFVPSEPAPGKRRYRRWIPVKATSPVTRTYQELLRIQRRALVAASSLTKSDAQPIHS